MPNIYPKLRPIEVRPFFQDGRPMLLLRDPLALSGQVAVLPQALGPALALCDGTRTLYGIRAALLAQYRLQVETGVLAEVVEALDQIYLLENERSAAAAAEALAAYRAAAHRPPASAGAAYPADAEALRALLDGCLAEARGVHGDAVAPRAGVRGLISPHIDFARGARVYAAAWERAAEAARAADLVVIFGTDHSGGHGALTLTRQHYATPYGVLPTAQEAVDAAAAALGAEAAFAEELHHRGEHSIELAAVWLHHMRGGAGCEVVPVLCGSFGHFVAGAANPAGDGRIAALAAALRSAAAGRRVLVVAAGDLAHVGPAFGGAAVAAEGREALRAADLALLAEAGRGNAAGFFGALQRDQDGNNVCGLPPIYLALRLLAPASGELVAYEQCPADEHDASWVSVAGMVWG